jgi:DNA-binding MarR family transcriptional regulator
MLKQSLTYLLASIADEGIGRADRLFEQRFGWSVRELRVLRLVHDNPGITFTELARLTRFERSATSRILTRLIKAGLVRRVGVEADRRRFELSATAKGVRLCAKADPLSLELEELMLAPLTARQRAELLAMMERMRAWVEGGYAARIAERFPEAEGSPPAGGEGSVGR